MDTALKIKKLEYDQELRKDILEILKNPVFNMIAGVFLIEALGSIKKPDGGSMMGSMAGPMETVIVSKDALAALSNTGGDLAKIAGDLAPIIALLAK